MGTNNLIKLEALVEKFKDTATKVELLPEDEECFMETAVHEMNELIKLMEYLASCA